MINNVVDVNLIRVSNYFALKRYFRVAIITNFSPDKISKNITIEIISHFFLNLLIDDIPFLYNDVSRINDLIQLRIQKFILI